MAAVFCLSRQFASSIVRLYKHTMYLRRPKRFINCCEFSSISEKDLEYAKALDILGVDSVQSRNKEAIKAAYLKLARKFHPDSQSGHGSGERFVEVSQVDID